MKTCGIAKGENSGDDGVLGCFSSFFLLG